METSNTLPSWGKIYCFQILGRPSCPCCCSDAMVLTQEQFEHLVDDTPVPWPIPFSIQVYAAPASGKTMQNQPKNPAQVWCWGTAVHTWRDKVNPGTQMCHWCLSKWAFVMLLPLAGWTPHTSLGRINLVSMSGRTRNNGFKLQPGRSRPDIKINFLTAKVVKLQKR